MIKNKPKVLFIMHMPPPVHGASMMGQYIHDSKLISESFECRYINETLSNSIDEIGKSGLHKLARLYKHVLNIYKTIKQYRPNLIYITPGGGNPSLGCIRYVFEFLVINHFGCHKLIHFHNKGTKEQTSKWYVRWYYHLMFKNADVVFLSKLLVPQYENYLKKENIHICPNGIYETLDHEPKVEKSNVIPKIFFLSNLIISKGVLILLDAIKILKDKGYQLECDFVGNESFDLTTESFNKEINNRGLSECVKYHGKKYGADKIVYFQNADIFVFPTFYSGECFPLVLLEAMEYKLPLISTNNGAIEDIVIDEVNGFVCKQQDLQGLALSIEKLINSKELREKMGEEGYKIFKQNFTIKSFENNLNEIICKVLRKLN